MKKSGIKKLKIEMVHDIVCSWCPIGFSNMQAAIRNLNIEVDFNFIPYELNPEMPEKGEAIASYFKRLFGWDNRKLLDYQGSLVETALNAGVTIDFSKRVNYYNTRKAHKLMHWAERFNKQTAVNKKLIEAYFEQGKDIGETEALLDIAVQSGLDRMSTQNALISTELAQEFESQVERQKALNIRSIPAFILNENTLISGSHSVKFFEKALSSLIDEQVSKANIAV